MNGFFLTQEDAKHLGLLDNILFNELAQKTIVVITVKDVFDRAEELDISNFTFTDEQRIELANWFYRNYYESFMESVLYDYREKN